MQEFRNLTSLTELDLSDNDISTLPPELVSLRKHFPIALIGYDCNNYDTGFLTLEKLELIYYWMYENSASLEITSSA